MDLKNKKKTEIIAGVSALLVIIILYVFLFSSSMKIEKSQSLYIYPGNNKKYANIPKTELPQTENLDDTIKRVLKYWQSDISKDLIANKKVIIVAHGNSLRGLIKCLDKLTDTEVLKLEIPTGKPICYELDNNLKPIRHYYI